MPRRRRRRKRRVKFNAGKVFTPSKGDLEFDLGLEAARYKAKKGEGGNRAPPPVPPSKDAGPSPWGSRRWA